MGEVLRTQAIQRFLQAYTHADLASLYNHDMEVQVNVAQDGGERIDGDYKGRQWHGWTDGVQTWKPIRIPYKANTEPEYTDIPIRYDLEEHAEGIGMTGWDWKAKLSRWVAFDFDHLTGHSERHTKKLSTEELEQLKDAVKSIPWVTLRYSTSGKGLHLYVFVSPVETQNHTEHAALARSILGKLSQTTSFDFQAKVDICGGNMWVWHRKMRGTDGLKLIKSGDILPEIPLNWRDHMKVTSRHRTKSVPKFVEDQLKVRPEIQDTFDELSGQRVRIALDDSHKALLKWIEGHYITSSWWDNDHWMLVTHTAILKEAHSALGLKGIFETLATGKEKGLDHNCFAFPIHKGAWAIRRYSPGVSEHASWEQDGAGWTRCFFNREPDLSVACRINDGIEDPSGGFWFQNAEQAEKAAFALGATLELPHWLRNRRAKLKEHKSGKLIVEITHESQDPGLPNWLSAKSKWTRMFEVKMAPPNEPETVTFDDEVRHIIGIGGEDAGWVIKADNQWHSEPLVHVKSYLQSRGLKPQEVVNVIGSSVARCWQLVNLPFQEEYPGNRQWNKDGARFRFTPTQNKDNLNYGNWTKVLNHCGVGLDFAIKKNAWCRSNGIFTGGDYLKCWVGSVFQKPLDPLPYLFFYGEQDTGKSIFHEALEELVTRGYQRADTALTSSSNFNSELESAILCIIEETDLRRDRRAYDRIKDWVTGKKLAIHRKNAEVYMGPNSTHWIQCANTHLACPVFPGDTRITMIHVPPLDPLELIPKKELMDLLVKEAPDFLAEILSLELPKVNDRLALPVIVTEEKLAAQTANQSLLEMFLEDKCHYVEGEKILFSEFYEAFIGWIDPNYIKDWSKIRVGRELPMSKYPKGRMPPRGEFWIGNISWEKKEAVNPKLILSDGRLV